MPIDRKEIENAPMWIEHIKNPKQSAKVAKFLRNNKQKSFTHSEISEKIRGSVSLSCINGLESALIIENRGGFIYIKDESRCKELVRISNI
jgi:hypothetical protein